MAEAVAAGIGFDVVPAKGEQWPHDMPLDRQNAMEAGEACAAQEVDEESFGGVVAMVCGEYRRIALLLTKRGEPIVAELTRGLLDALPMAAGMGSGVELCQMEGDTVATGKPADEGLVAVAVAGTQIEIAVGNGKRIACGMHEMGQHHRIDTPANGQQHLLPSGEEVLLSDVGYEAL